MQERKWTLEDDEEEEVESATKHQEDHIGPIAHMRDERSESRPRPRTSFVPRFTSFVIDFCFDDTPLSLPPPNLRLYLLLLVCYGGKERPDPWGVPLMILDVVFDCASQQGSAASIPRGRTI